MKRSSDLPPEVVPLLQYHMESLKNSSSQLSFVQDKLTYAGISTDEETISNPTAGTIVLDVNTVLVLSQVPLVKGDEQYDEQSFPKGILDMNNQQLDLRRTNSWLMKLSEVSTIELVEVTSINQLSPFIMCSKLKPLMLRSPAVRKRRCTKRR